MNRFRTALIATALAAACSIAQAVTLRVANQGDATSMDHLQAQTKATHFSKILRRDTSFHLLVWTPGTCDAHNALPSLVATPTLSRVQLADNLMPSKYITVK